MIHFINEGGNSELKHRVFPLSKGIKKHLIDTLRNYRGDKTIEGYKRLNNLLSMTNGISYSEMKRLKNFLTIIKVLINQLNFCLMAANL